MDVDELIYRAINTLGADVVLTEIIKTMTEDERIDAFTMIAEDKGVPYDDL